MEGPLKMNWVYLGVSQFILRDHPLPFALIWWPNPAMVPALRTIHGQLPCCPLPWMDGACWAKDFSSCYIIPLLSSQANLVLLDPEAALYQVGIWHKHVLERECLKPEEGVQSWKFHALGEARTGDVWGSDSLMHHHVTQRMKHRPVDLNSLDRSSLGHCCLWTFLLYWKSWETDRAVG